MNNNITLIQRRFDDWDYKAISQRLVDGKPRDIIYYELIDKGVLRKGVKIYRN